MKIPDHCPECNTSKSNFTWDGMPRSKNQGIATSVVDMWLGCDHCSHTIIYGITLDDFLNEFELFKVGCNV